MKLCIVLLAVVTPVLSIIRLFPLGCNKIREEEKWEDEDLNASLQLLLPRLKFQCKIYGNKGNSFDPTYFYTKTFDKKPSEVEDYEDLSNAIQKAFSPNINLEDRASRPIEFACETQESGYYCVFKTDPTKLRGILAP